MASAKSSFSQSARSPYSSTPFTRERPGTSCRTTGGGWSKADRFFNPEIKDNTPGPIYHPPENIHIQSPLYKQPITDDNDGLLHPSRDRSAWIVGTTKNDMTFYTDISIVGPNHNPNIDAVKTCPPKTKFPKDQRFKPLNIIYMGKELDRHGNISTVSPGPIYYPKLSQSELQNPIQPVYSFGGGNRGDRGVFLSATVNSGMFYTGIAATAERHVHAGPSSYTPKHEQLLPTAPRAKFPKDQRFKPLHILYMGKKLDKHGNISTASPGPCYYPKNEELSSKILQKPYAHVKPGKWCP